MTGSKEMFYEERGNDNIELENVLPSEALSLKTLSLFETTRLQRQGFISEIMSKIDSGEVDPLLIHLQLKSTADIMDMLTNKKDYPEIANKYMTAVLEAAQKHGEKKFGFHNSTIEIKEVGTVYDWTKCEDELLNDMLLRLEDSKAAIKKRQDFLKTVPEKGMDLVIDDEVVKVYPPAKTSTTAIAVTLK